MTATPWRALDASPTSTRANARPRLHLVGRSSAPNRLRTATRRELATWERCMACVALELQQP